MNRKYRKGFGVAVLIVTVVMVSTAFSQGQADKKTAVVATNQPQATTTINWQPYGEGLELAKKQGQKLYLYFFSNRCFYCSMMEKKTFTDAATIDFINEKFTAVRVNTDENLLLAKEYNIHGVPVSIFLEQNGDLIGSRPGYLPPDDFIKMLHFVDSEQYKE